MAFGIQQLLLTILLFGGTWAEQARFDGYKVFRLFPRNAAQAELVQELDNLGAIFWNGPNPAFQNSDVMLPPHMLDLMDSVRLSGLNVTEYIPDVQKVIDETSMNVLSTRAKGQQLEFDKYHRYDVIVDWLKEQAEVHSDIASIINIGQTYEGRDLLVLKIAKPGNGPKRAIWLDATIHSREWITCGVTLYIINELLNGNDPVIKKWIDDFDLHILAVHNPDGYEFSHTGNRLWRKTRSGKEKLCRGADPNRNYGFKWRTGGSSTNPCTDTYAGTAAFSEPETKNAAAYIDTIASTLDLYISLHSYSQLILIPYGVRTAFPGHQKHMTIGRNAAAAIAKRYNTQFTTGNIVDLLYVASGGSTDWAAGVHNIPITFTFELRDKGRYAFLLPPAQIIPSSLELIDGLAVMVDAARAESRK